MVYTLALAHTQTDKHSGSSSLRAKCIWIKICIYLMKCEIPTHSPRNKNTMWFYNLYSKTAFDQNAFKHKPNNKLKLNPRNSRKIWKKWIRNTKQQCRWLCTISNASTLIIVFFFSVSFWNKNVFLAPIIWFGQTNLTFCRIGLNIYVSHSTKKATHSNL